MRPKPDPEQPQRELFQIGLEQLLDMSHPLVRLGLCIDWSSFEQTLGDTYHPSQGAPCVSTRLMVALHYLKYQHDLSDEDVVADWVGKPKSFTALIARLIELSQTHTEWPEKSDSAVIDSGSVKSQNHRNTGLWTVKYRLGYSRIRTENC